MRAGLMEKHFPSREQELEAQRHETEEFAMLRERVKHWLDDPYNLTFRDWLSDTERKVEPQPGEHGNMLYQTGQRDGIRMVLDHLNTLEREIKRRE